jgi:hypothetical protein
VAEGDAVEKPGNVAAKFISACVTPQPGEAGRSFSDLVISGLLVAFAIGGLVL